MRKTYVKKRKTQRKRPQKGGFIINNIDDTSLNNRSSTRARSRSRSRLSTPSANRRNKDYKP
jgi:hypothetical protein